MLLDTDQLPLIEYPDPRLRKRCATIDVFDDRLAALAARMIELMRRADGIGLAAPQLGVLSRLFVCNATGEPGDDRVFVNPKISPSGDTVIAEEGCLSIPEVKVNVARMRLCRIGALDLTGHPIRLDGADLVARCWQHECDHLEGRLITDRMSETDRIANRKALKALEAEYRRRK